MKHKNNTRAYGTLGSILLLLLVSSVNATYANTSLIMWEGGGGGGGGGGDFISSFDGYGFDSGAYDFGSIDYAPTDYSAISEPIVYEQIVSEPAATDSTASVPSPDMSVETPVGTSESAITEDSTVPDPNSSFQATQPDVTKVENAVLLGASDPNSPIAQSVNKVAAAIVRAVIVEPYSGEYPYTERDEIFQRIIQDPEVQKTFSDAFVTVYSDPNIYSIITDNPSISVLNTVIEAIAIAAERAIIQDLDDGIRAGELLIFDNLHDKRFAVTNPLRIPLAYAEVVIADTNVVPDYLEQAVHDAVTAVGNQLLARIMGTDAASADNVTAASAGVTASVNDPFTESVSPESGRTGYSSDGTFTTP